jgi:hypothetical protein
MPGTASAAKPQCNNQKDDDGDGKIDYPTDPGCNGRGDKSEVDPIQPPPPPPPPPGGLMATGFENNLTLDPMATTGNAPHQWFRGTDLSTGFNFNTIQFWGSGVPAWATLSVVCATSNPAANYIASFIGTVTGHTGASTKALKQEFFAPWSGGCQQTAMKNTNSYSQPIHDYYTSFWLRQNADMQTEANSINPEYWRIPWQYKATDDFRLSIFQLNYQGNQLRWFLQADNRGASDTLPPNGQFIYLRTEWGAPVPIDQWMHLEIYHHRTNDNNGVFKFYVNDQLIFNWANWNFYGVQGDEINNLAHPILYSSYHNASHQWVDDIYVSEFPPCGVASLPCGP